MSDGAPAALACTSDGDGPALVVLHGLFGAGNNWRGITRALTARWRVHLVDARNHGGSPHRASMRYADMAADTSALIERVAPDGAHLLGHSMGGKTAMMTALAHAQQVLSLVVADVAPVAYRHDFDAELAALRAVDLDRIERRGDADALLAERIDEPALRAFLLQNLVRRDDRWRWRLNLDAIERGIAELTGFEAPAARYTGPTTFIHGARSHYLRDAHRPAVEALFPTARVVPVADAGHWLHAEQPAAFAAALAGHLDAL